MVPGSMLHGGNDWNMVDGLREIKGKRQRERGRGRGRVRGEVMGDSLSQHTVHTMNMYPVHVHFTIDSSYCSDCQREHSRT